MGFILLEDRARIPANIVDLESFRHWALSDDFPNQGRYSYLGGDIWVDLSMEQLFTHNRVKVRMVSVLDTLAEENELGSFFSDRTLLSNLDVDLSTEPDGVFVSFDAERELRVRYMEGAKQGYVEIVGTPDMVLEVVSDGSVRKDMQILRRLYWEAGILEYWLVDARRDEPQFDILRRGSRGYIATRAQDGWLRSNVFGHLFRLTQRTGPTGNPRYTLEMLH